MDRERERERERVGVCDCFSLQGPADNPKVNAIVVLKGPFQQTGVLVCVTPLI